MATAATVAATMPTATVMTDASVLAAVVLNTMMFAAVVLATVMFAAMVFAAVVLAAMVFAAVVLAAMVFAAVVTVATVMVPVVPALTAAEAAAAAEFEADDIPAGTVPAVVIPAVCLSVGDEFVAARRDRAFDLQPPPAIGSGTSRHSCQSAPLSAKSSLSSMSAQLAAERSLPLRLIWTRDQPSVSGTSFHNWQEPLSYVDPEFIFSSSLHCLASRYLPFSFRCSRDQPLESERAATIGRRRRRTSIRDEVKRVAENLA